MDNSTPNTEAIPQQPEQELKPGLVISIVWVLLSCLPGISLYFTQVEIAHSYNSYPAWFNTTGLIITAVGAIFDMYVIGLFGDLYRVIAKASGVVYMLAAPGIWIWGTTYLHHHDNAINSFTAIFGIIAIWLIGVFSLIQWSIDEEEAIEEEEAAAAAWL